MDASMRARAFEALVTLRMLRFSVAAEVQRAEHLTRHGAVRRQAVAAMVAKIAERARRP